MPGLSVVRCTWRCPGCIRRFHCARRGVGTELGVPAVRCAQDTGVYTVPRYTWCGHGARCARVTCVTRTVCGSAGNPRGRCYVVSEWNLVWARDTQCYMQCVRGNPVLARMRCLSSKQVARLLFQDGCLKVGWVHPTLRLSPGSSCLPHPGFLHPNVGLVHGGKSLLKHHLSVERQKVNIYLFYF